LGRRATAPPIPARDAIRGIVGLGCVLVAVIPALILTSQRSIDDASAAFRDGDCATTLADARDARSALDLRPEPYQLTALCQLRARQWTPGIITLKRALARDPDDWELHYVLAWGQAAAGLDPRAEALRAWRLNRLDPSANMLFRFVRSARPAGWRRHG